MVKELLDSEILLNKNNKCLFSYLYLQHNDLTKIAIITVIAITKITVLMIKITIIVLTMLIITK